MNLAQLLAAGSSLGLPRLDAQLLLLHALGRPASERAWLSAHDTDVVTQDVEQAFSDFCRRRARGEPLAYIVGRKEFFGLDLMVDSTVLVPRPDTETLVEWALEILRCHPDPPSVIDLGTGSGAIALAIKKHWPEAMVEAVDASAEALEVAAANAGAHSLEIRLRQASWLAGTTSQYDLIVSNPPYLAQADSHLPALAYEPVQALVGGHDGMAELRAIIAQAPGRLRPGGWLLLEHGFDQALAVRELLAAAGFRSVVSRLDLAGIERCSGGRWLELG
jgi:release factor glutamine methyltransferase